MTTAALRRASTPPRSYATAAGAEGELLAAIAFGALCAFALLSWGRLVTPGWSAGALATGIAATVVAAGGLRRGTGRLARLLPWGVLCLTGLLLAGVPPRLLLPDRWPDLVAGIAEGAGTLSSLTVPYGGGDAWARRTLLLIGVAFAIAAALAYGRGRATGSRGPAIVALLGLYAVGVVQLAPGHPGLSGAVCAALLGAALWADRVPAGLGPIAAALIAAGIVAGAVALPVLDRERPAIDLQQLASDVARSRTATFRWDHDYGPLQWPRRGRQVLEVSATTPAYWKAEVLDGFDGRVWRQAGGVASFEPASDRRLLGSRWTRRIRVRVRDLKSTQFIGAGETLGIQRPPVPAVAQAGGFFVSDTRPLVRGDSYTATVYTPRPSPRQLARAGSIYPSFARLWLQVDLPGARVARTPVDRGVPVEAQFAPFGRADATLLSFRAGGSGIIPSSDPDAVVRTSGLGRVYALARRLRAQARTPYGFVLAVQARVRAGARYDERPPASKQPLDTFLFDVRRGYCQHFSGSMALLLRMGGVPARVVSGFSPGTYDRAHRRFVVTDLDAHSWVEAYFPHLGWITFDPTPGASPARAQFADLATGGRVRPARRGAPGGDRPGDRPAGTAAGADRGLTVRRALLAGLVLAAVLLALVLAGRRRRRPAELGPPELAELERALRRTGREPGAGTSLTALRATLGSCGGYLDALIARRFAPGGGPAPTTRQRRELRRALGDGLGLRGRVRAWLALPPRPPWAARR